MRSLDFKKITGCTKTQDVDRYQSLRTFISYIGDDPDREGLCDTPKRVVDSWKFLFSGYSKNEKDIYKVFDAEGYDELIILKDIEFYSTCEHHVLPFFGKVHIAYIANKKVIGISKIARLVELFSRRLQIQERLTQQITTSLNENLKPIGVACVIEAEHMCMKARGVEKQNAKMVTSSLCGVFREDTVKGMASRSEVLHLLGVL